MSMLCQNCAKEAAHHLCGHCAIEISNAVVKEIEANVRARYPRLTKVAALIRAHLHKTE